MKKVTTVNMDIKLREKVTDFIKSSDKYTSFSHLVRVLVAKEIDKSK